MKSLYRITISRGEDQILEAAVTCEDIRQAHARALELKAQVLAKEQADDLAAGIKPSVFAPRRDVLVSTQRICEVAN